jgi:hypothetical protein
MPIEYQKQAFTLQEKIDKAMELTFELRKVADSEFMRAFLLELIEKCFKKLLQERHLVGEVHYPDEHIIQNQIENYKRMQQ